MNRGLFITFEGIDGCGKSTQLHLLRQSLQEDGIGFTEVREPGGTVVGEKIRNILLDKRNDSMTRLAELLLFEAARAQITEEVIRPALQSGKHVICDRFYDSTSAYQGFAGDMGEDLTGFLNNTATDGLEPDITFLLDIDPLTAARRREGRGGADRIELMGIAFQEKVRQGYLKISKNNPRIRVIDASAAPDVIFAGIKKEIWDLIH